MPILKCCGIRRTLTSYEHIDRLWFNFVKSSRRYISPEQAKNIFSPKNIFRIGVFGFPDGEKSWKNIDEKKQREIVEIAKNANMQGLQIYGKCDFQFFKQHDFLTISAIQIQDLDRYENNTYIDFLLIDGKNPGSGKSYNYEIISQCNISQKFLIAGGINEKNISSVCKIFANNPYFHWVDLASAVDNGENICPEKIKNLASNIPIYV